MGALITMPPLSRTARTFGAAEADGDPLLLLDDDSYPRPGTVRTLRDAFTHNQGLALPAELVLQVDRDGQGDPFGGSRSF